MRSCNGGTPAIATPSNLLINPLFHQLQLGSDIQECLTRTGLTPSPARCNFRVFPTVFVIVFHSFYKFHSVNYTEKSRFRQGLDKDICCFPRQIFLFFFFCLPHHLFYAILSTHKWYLHHLFIYYPIGWTFPKLNTLSRISDEKHFNTTFIKHIRFIC